MHDDREARAGAVRKAAVPRAAALVLPNHGEYVASYKYEYVRASELWLVPAFTQHAMPRCAHAMT